MNHNQHASTRTLILVWLGLIAATSVTMVAGKVTQITSIGPVWVGLLIIVTWLKATLIVWYYLNLKAATGGWWQVFAWLTGAVLATIFALYIAI